MAHSTAEPHSRSQFALFLPTHHSAKAQSVSGRSDAWRVGYDNARAKRQRVDGAVFASAADGRDVDLLFRLLYLSGFQHTKVSTGPVGCLQKIDDRPRHDLRNRI